MPKEILRSGQLNIELDSDQVAAFREVYDKVGLMPGDIVYALIKQKLREYRETGRITFGPDPRIETAVVAAAHSVEKETTEDAKPPTPQQLRKKG